MNPFTTALVKAPKRARFDFSHTNTVGVKFGALSPTLNQFIIPGDDVSVSLEQIARLAPMPVPTFVPLKVRHDFFFVPLRLLYGPEYLDRLFGSDTELQRACVPSLNDLFGTFNSVYSGRINPFSPSQFFYGSDSTLPVPGTLLDYLGYPVWTDRNEFFNISGMEAALEAAVTDPDIVNVLQYIHDGLDTESNINYTNAIQTSGSFVIEPIIAYHFIWRDWYRFTGVQDNNVPESFLNNGVLSVWNNEYNAEFHDPDTAVEDWLGSYLTQGTTDRMYFGDLGKLKYAHATKDMFTSARYGNKPTVLIPTGDAGTIPALREASAVQRFLDILSITGNRYFDKVRGLFGVEPVGPKDDRVQFLGRYQQYIKIGEVLTTATTDNAQTGDYAGRGILIDGKYIFKRHFTEHGWLMCITSVTPDLSYDGVSRQLTDVHPIDTPIPSLAEVGDQSIFAREFQFLFQALPNAPINTYSLGDQFRYYAYKSAPNEVHGSFKMETMRPWSGLRNRSDFISRANIINLSRIEPADWNFIFNDTSNERIFGDRFFFNLDFSMFITRALPKYINYHL